MFSITNFSDVVMVAKTFGKDSLSFIVDNNTMSSQANQVIIECRKWANDRSVLVEEFNDGNREYSTVARFTSSKATGVYETSLADIIISRTGFSDYVGYIGDALKENVITKEQMTHILSTIKTKNECATAIL